MSEPKVELAFKLDIINEAGLISPADLSSLDEFEPLVLQVNTVNTVNAGMYLRDFLRAIEAASRLHAKSLFDYEKAKDRTASMRSIAILDKAPEGLRDRELRVTEENVKQFAVQDENYINAREAESYWKAMSTYIENRLRKYEKAHDDVKKLIADSRYSGNGGALPSGTDAA